MYFPSNFPVCGVGLMRNLQIKSSHLSKELDCTTLCNSFIVLFKIMLIYLLSFSALIGSGVLCSSSLVLFRI